MKILKTINPNWIIEKIDDRQAAEAILRCEPHSEAHSQAREYFHGKTKEQINDVLSAHLHEIDPLNLEESEEADFLIGLQSGGLAEFVDDLFEEYIQLFELTDDEINETVGAAVEEFFKDTEEEHYDTEEEDYKKANEAFLRAVGIEKNDFAYYKNDRGLKDAIQRLKYHTFKFLEENYNE